MRKRERGATLILVVIGMLAFIAMAGLALDTSHVLLNKSRLQSALDAAALAAAKQLDLSGNTASATADANGNFALNLAQYPELQSAGVTMTTQYSSTLNPFNPGTAPATFVRTTVTGFTTPMSLISALGITSVNVAGNAVAGPSPALTTACNVAPVVMCATKGVGKPLFGYAQDQVVGLNQSAGTAGTIGPGNYGLLALGGNGANIVRQNLAGSYASCGTIGNTVATEPGVAAGPVEDGINARFNVYKGGLSAATYPPDVVNTVAHQTSLTGNGSNVKQGATTVTTASQIAFNYANYTNLVTHGNYDTAPLPGGTAAFDRRIIAVPLGDCTGLANGKNTIDILGFACVFLLQQLGNGANANTIYGQILSGCQAKGQTGPGAGASGPHKIELYKSAGSPDS
jgi:hypothetical protein